MAAVVPLDEICESMSQLAEDIADCQSPDMRQEMKARFEALEAETVDENDRFPTIDYGERYFGALSEYACRSGPNGPTLFQRVRDLKQKFDEGRPQQEGE